MRTSPQNAYLRLLGILILALGTSACDEDPTEQTTTTPQCESSADCIDAEAGFLCVEGACVPCDGDAACAADPTYGSDAPLCTAGVCSPCPDGDIGCACTAEGTCNQGECIEQACVDCDRGDIGCVCRANGTCTDGAVCDANGELCEACTPGVEFCPCDEGDVCGDGLICESGTCVEDTCVAGAQDCPCDTDSACASGELYCDEVSVCRLCTNDIPGCPCDADDVCLGDNYCDLEADTTCAACPETEKPETCGCEGGSDCADGLVCDADEGFCRQPVACVDAGCVDFQICDATLGDAYCVPETCEDGYTWDSETETCIEEVLATCFDANGDPTQTSVDCEAAGQACADSATGAVCVDTCSTLNCQDQSRDCAIASSSDESATCGNCEPGYTETTNDDGDLVCVVDTNVSCSVADPSTIADDCALRGRECVPVTGGGATCGDCLSGREFDPDTNVCLEVERCGAEICDETEFCYYNQAGDPPVCTARCADGEAMAADGTCTTCSIVCDNGLYGALVDGQCACNGEVYCSYQTDGGAESRCQVNPCPEGEATLDGVNCSVCSLSCGDDAGEGSRVWPWRNRSGECFCETQQDYYQPYGAAATPISCDRDGDGWINETARDTYDDAARLINGNQDTAVLANFRCERRVIDRFVLENEYGQKREVGLCQGQLSEWAPGNMPAACDLNQGGELTELVLFETDTIDAENSIGLDDTLFPRYGDRKLKAAEINALTKACVSIDGDYNHNGTEDLMEFQPLTKTDVPVSGTVTDEAFMFRAMSFFLELNKGRYVAPTGTSNAGQYRITERRRCADTFPVTYSVGRDFYWEGCMRRRPADYDENGDRTTMDFAAFSCSNSTGSCELASSDIFETGANVDGDRVEDHDLCALETAGLLPLDDTPWLGMNHQSQFQCARISTSSSANYVVARSNLNGAAGSDMYDFNACGATDCTGKANCSESTTQSATVAQPLDPVIGCAYEPGDAVSVPDDSVGIVATRFVNASGSYTSGCMNEALGGTISDTPNTFEAGKGWSRLCPGFMDRPDSVLTAGNLGDFGKLICSCGENFAGENCEIACATRYELDFYRDTTQGGDPANLPLRTGDSATYTAAQKAEYSCNDTNYCSLYPPDTTTGFPGGRKGFWMCGEFAATLDTDGNPFHSATDGAGSTYELRGGIRVDATVVREKLAPSSCTAGTGDCFELF